MFNACKEFCMLMSSFEIAGIAGRDMINDADFTFVFF